ncbi:unnamed protein product [Paramecium primaurelia]|uniref:Response regulatory domain-containing protein n=1 Tax=Paramecium primaurelia TaxID=5886 RepID=A0A8S1PH01_PARPR|nr:unnamed protein product [Paramecium primaurelia]
MTEEIFSLILLIYYEICIILLQHQGKLNFKIILAFNKNESLIIKIIDLITMIITTRVLFYVKSTKKNSTILTILSGFRISIQITLSYFCQAEILQVYLNLLFIYSLYQDQLQNQMLSKLPQLFLIGNVFFVQTFQDNFKNIAIAFTCISIIYSFKSIKTIQALPENNKDFGICISALPQKDLDLQRSCDFNGLNSKSQVYGGLSPLKELSRSMDTIIFEEYAWIKGQQFIVLDEQVNVVIQTFNVADISKNSFSNSVENESVAAILNLGIIQGNRDFQDIVASSGTINQSKLLIKDLIFKLIGDYELYKNNLFVINKVDVQWMQDRIIKIFLVAKMKKTFVFVQIEQREIVFQTSYQAFNLFCSYITPSLNSIMTISVLAESDTIVNDLVFEKYLYPIRVASVIVYLQLANMRDFNLHNQKKFLLKVSTIDISTICEDLIIMVQDSARAKGIEIKIDQESIETIDSDAERLKQLMLPLIRYFIIQTKDENITITWKFLASKNYQVIIYTPINIDDLRQFKLNLKKPTPSFSEFNICHILAQYLSGTAKKGLDISFVEPQGTAITFIIQSFNLNNEEMKAIKLISGTHYQETSLSQMLVMQDTSKQNDKTYTLFREESNKVSMDHSLHFSQSRISKQFSQKYSEYQSNYFSQISKIKADQTSCIFHQDDETKHLQRLNYQTTPSQSKYQLPHFPDATINNSINNNSVVYGNTLNIDGRDREQTFISQQQISEIKQPTSSNLYLDFGVDAPSQIQIPVSRPVKMQGEIIKFSTSGKCCSRVLIADYEFQNIQILEMILTKFKILSSRAFSTDEVLKMIETKKKCKCGNSSFVLFFINVDLPKKGGLWLSKQIKDKMTQKGHIIGTTGLVEYHSKIEYYKYGIDQYISLPFDLAEVSKILQISQNY